ncbi:MAG TPA: hypothetical protein VFE46_06380 [Pirellulales bacterium]|jgi:hypothetical protein|nr:hypothetical protein [Pirellulales bacterium]
MLLVPLEREQSPQHFGKIPLGGSKRVVCHVGSLGTLRYDA